MWVRSQDKRRLIDANNFVIGDKKIITFNIEGFIDLGKYKTDERALEVLNEIENTIEDCCKSLSLDYRKVVFEMPEE